jgi:hypothetical protein
MFAAKRMAFQGDLDKALEWLFWKRLYEDLVSEPRGGVDDPGEGDATADIP